MKTIKKYRSEFILFLLGFIQCIAFLLPGNIPSWVYSIDLIFLILFIIMYKLDHMDQNLKNRC
ncbi:MAG: hypothetical protein RR673_09425 [Erysipelotrichaceae bacterium]